MDILWMIGLYLVCGVVVLVGLNKIDNYFIKKAIENYNDDILLFRIHSKWVALILLVSIILIWPIAYTVLEIWLIKKYLKAKKNWKKEMKYKKEINEIIEKWTAYTKKRDELLGRG